MLLTPRVIATEVATQFRGDATGIYEGGWRKVWWAPNLSRERLRASLSAHLEKFRLVRTFFSLADLFSAVRTAWPATRPAHSFFQFRAYPLDVLSSGFRFLDGDNPADPLITREWRNVLPFCPSSGIGNESLSQIRRYLVHRARGERFLAH